MFSFSSFAPLFTHNSHNMTFVMSCSGHKCQESWRNLTYADAEAANALLEDLTEKLTRHLFEIFFKQSVSASARIRHLLCLSPIYKIPKANGVWAMGQKVKP